MHAVKLLHTLFTKSCESIDKRLSRVIFEAAESLTRCKQLSIVSIGRSLSRAALVKHNIKCIDRLFGNKSLHKKSILYYRDMACHLLKNNAAPLIIIDWSGLTRCGAYHFLRASVVMDGRALTLYDQAYSLKDYGTSKSHRGFLKMLRTILPKKCRPIIITDAGFRNTWFKTVTNMEWDFVGRVRNLTHCCATDSVLWRPVKNLYTRATQKATYLGEFFLAKSNRFICHLYLSKQGKKYRVKRNLAGKKIQCSVSKKHEKRENEPWLIASSLSPAQMNAQNIMLIYKKRMQIEESFRDLKNTRHGFSLRHCRSYEVNRLNVALLIAALAMLVLWLYGIAIKSLKHHYSYQTNTTKSRNVLSGMFIGWQALQRNDIKIKKQALMTALDKIASLSFWRAI